MTSMPSCQMSSATIWLYGSLTFDNAYAAVRDLVIHLCSKILMRKRMLQPNHIDEAPAAQEKWSTEEEHGDQNTEGTLAAFYCVIRSKGAGRREDDGRTHLAVLGAPAPEPGRRCPYRRAQARRVQTNGGEVTATRRSKKPSRDSESPRTSEDLLGSPSFLLRIPNESLVVHGHS